MANVVRFKNGKAEYLMSVNTPEYSNDVDCIINPDISSVKDIPLKYWKRVGSTIAEMTLAEKTIVDSTELMSRKATADSLDVSIIDIVEAIIVAGNTQWANGKTVTKQQIINYIKSNIT